MSFDQLIKVGLEDVAQAFDIGADLYEIYEGEILKNKNLISMMKAREEMGDWKKVTSLGGPGTTLNGVALYCLIRHYDLVHALETGVSGGFYSGFLFESLKRNRQPGSSSVSVELSTSDDVGILLPEELRCSSEWLLTQGADSIEFLQDNQASFVRPFDLFCHDSLHTMKHMMKELMEFKKCEKPLFLVFIDDQNSDEFWRRCLQIGAFKKPGYDVQYISGNESRLNGHLGGVIKYEKA